ncbi:MAG TPA: nicotinate phosphoribosyltransferase [Candidatus Binataceae bacterium]
MAMTVDLGFDPNEASLLIDLYELMMAAALFEENLNDAACFSLSVRRLPANRGYLVAAGIERLLDVLEAFHFGPAAISYLESLKLFPARFLDHLARLRFSGEVRALAEGAIFFADEPLLEIRGPLIETQLFETIALNLVGTASLIASKAARCVSVAGGRRLVDFGMRRAHGTEAGLIAARSSYLTGFVGTSNVLAGRRYGVPLYGTMAHSYVMAHETERAAFESFARVFPGLSTLLVDTYSTPKGVENAVAVARNLRASGFKLQGVRLDSGDLAALSRPARRLLDQNGLQEAAIFASGNLDEYAIADLVKAGAPIDAFGVGTAMVTSADEPWLDIIYKLVEYNGKPRAKTSPGKASIPGRKQIYRAFDGLGGMASDIITLIEEGAQTVARELKRPAADLKPLLVARFENGRRLDSARSLAESRQVFSESFAKLDQRYKAIRKPDSYLVVRSRALNALQISEKLRASARQ